MIAISFILFVLKQVTTITTNDKIYIIDGDHYGSTNRPSCSTTVLNIYL